MGFEFVCRPVRRVWRKRGEGGGLVGPPALIGSRRELRMLLISLIWFFKTEEGRSLNTINREQRALLGLALAGIRLLK